MLRDEFYQLSSRLPLYPTDFRPFGSVVSDFDTAHHTALLFNTTECIIRDNIYNLRIHL